MEWAAVGEVRKSEKSRVGRNQPCPCGSKRKYKRCHGYGLAAKIFPEQIAETSRAAQARRIQRERQQGLGRPIISAELNGTRFVAIKGRLTHSQRWKTFHDFLKDYLGIVLGREWVNEEQKKPLAQRHLVLRWYHHLCLHQWKFVTTPGELYSAPMTGAAAAYLGLAYDLYALDHNAELQERLVARLKNSDGFAGARYEAFVAATMIRAGFELEFENEQDGSTTHCEFTATSRVTGRKFSVEAKHREPGEASHTAKEHFRVGRRLQKALRKHANHDRIVFIDINVPDLATNSEFPSHFTKTLTALRRFEGRFLNGIPLPSAYLFVTNFPSHHYLDGATYRSSVMAEGFQIPDFKSDSGFPNLRRALEAREAHADMHRLVASIGEHTLIPSTFDGEIPEFAFGDAKSRLVVGEIYFVKDPDGIERRGRLTTATVSEAEKSADCVLALETGKSIIATFPLTDSELQAYRRFPETFFGTLIEPIRKVNSPLELYDTFLEAFRETSKERLLELMAAAPDIEHLKTLSQRDLASLYSERCVNAAPIQQFRKHRP
jgi:hypothetical protein